jgi:hypothetical protein
MDLSNPYASPVSEEPNRAPSELPADAQLVDAVPLPPGTITVEFQLVREDFELWLQHWKSRNPTPSMTRSATFGLLLVMLVLWIVAGFLTGRWLIFGPFIGVFAVLIILWVGLKLMIQWNEFQYPGGMNFNQPDLALTLWHRVALLPDYFVLANGLEQTLYRWRRFTEVQVTEHAIYLIDNQLTTHLIPRRAFASDAELDQFVETARGFQQRGIPVADRDLNQPSSSESG